MISGFLRSEILTPASFPVHYSAHGSRKEVDGAGIVVNNESRRIFSRRSRTLSFRATFHRLLFVLNENVIRRFFSTSPFVIYRCAIFYRQPFLLPYCNENLQIKFTNKIYNEHL